MTRLTPWTAAMATPGARFRFAYLAQDSSTPINAATVSQARLVLGMRKDVKILDVKQLGRVLQVDLETRAAAKLLSLVGEYTVAGDPPVTFRVVEVYSMPAGTSTAGAIVGKVASGVSYVANPLDTRMVTDVRDAIDRAVPDAADIGAQTGKALASAMVPLLKPLAIGFLAYTAINLLPRLVRHA